MIETKATPARMKGFALIRDKNGKPKIDNYETCHNEIKALLTKKEKEEFEKCL